MIFFSENDNLLKRIKIQLKDKLKREIEKLLIKIKIK